MAGTAADRGTEQSRVGTIERNDQKGAHGANIHHMGPAYGGGTKNQGKGASKISGSGKKEVS